MRAMRLIAALAAAGLATSAAQAKPVAVEVTEIVDGDTLVVRGDWAVVQPKPGRRLQFRVPGTVKVRILGIDTPEKGHLAQCLEESAHSKAAVVFSTGLLLEAGMKVRIERVQHDKYGGRLDAEVTIAVAGREVSLAQRLIEAGYARAYSGEGPKPDWCAILKNEGDL